MPEPTPPATPPAPPPRLKRFRVFAGGDLVGQFAAVDEADARDAAAREAARAGTPWAEGAEVRVEALDR